VQLRCCTSDLQSRSRDAARGLAFRPASIRISHVMQLPEPGRLTRSAEASRPASADAARLVLSVSEAAAALGISRAFAYELVAKNKLPSIRLGRRVLIPVERFYAFVSSTSGE
jgi:excisionase family DNA binding protein